MVSFADQIEEVDSILLDTFRDGCGDYQDANGQLLIKGIPLIIDRNLEHSGPDGIFMTQAAGLTWRHADLECAEQGGLFVVEGIRFIVEDIIADDGHMVTAVCQVQL
ncbi:hypothetical protein [Pseudomonas sp. LFM046]|uniref:hypothetical protein n=1 Tax=Pseudomonas sp. LFM046 TaxID=1608357 RepID=UPI00069903FB|nr:hypothetical protein [Pseudomonas sp. LFM046]